jgi:hypothetical protein
VLAPTRTLRLHWLEGTRQLILRVPYALLREIAGQEPEQPLALAPGFLLPRELGTQWELLAQSLLNLASTPQASAARAAWLDHFERNVALFLLSHQPSPAAPDCMGMPAAAMPDTMAAPAGTKALEAVHEYMLARLLLQPDASITESVLSFGFSHLGRFAGFYAERFQERPRDTQLRHRRRDGPESGE